MRLERDDIWYTFTFKCKNLQDVRQKEMPNTEMGCDTDECVGFDKSTIERALERQMSRQLYAILVGIRRKRGLTDEGREACGEASQVVALGEIGLDSLDDGTRKYRTGFRRQIQLSKDFNSTLRDSARRYEIIKWKALILSGDYAFILLGSFQVG